MNKNSNSNTSEEEQESAPLVEQAVTLDHAETLSKLSLQLTASELKSMEPVWARFREAIALDDEAALRAVEREKSNVLAAIQSRLAGEAAANAESSSADAEAMRDCSEWLRLTAAYGFPSNEERSAFANLIGL